MKNHSKSKTALYIATAGVIIYAGSFFVWEKLEQRLLTQKINSIREKTARVDADSQRINMEIMEMTSLNNLEQIGKKRFGLVTPDIADVVIIQDDVKK